MEHSKTNKPVLTALDILQFRNLQKQLLPPRNQLVPYQLSHVVAIDDSYSKIFLHAHARKTLPLHIAYMTITTEKD